MLRSPQTGRALAASFAAVAVAFTVGVAAAQTFSFRIRWAAQQITGNSAASISTLSAMRGRLRDLEARSDDFVDACGMGQCEAPPPRFDELRRLLHQEWQTYRALPTFPGETDRWPEVEAGLARLDGALARVRDEVVLHRPGQALDQFRAAARPAFDGVDQEIARLIVFDQQQGLALAMRIDDLARLSTVVSGVLVLLGVALTVVAAAIGIRVVRHYEESLRRQADDLEQFAGRVAHDIRSPLSATAAALHVVKHHASGAQRLAAERAERGVQRVSRLVEDLLQFARAGADISRQDVTDLNDVLNDVVDELRPAAEHNRVELHLEAPRPQRVACSPGVLSSVLSNLVRNAIVHMGTRDQRQVRIRVETAASTAAVRIAVEDTGPGIPEALGDRIFEPFVRGEGADQAGSGLGLATVKRLVTAHGGSVGFRSRAGVGTQFFVELPRAREPHRPS